MNTRIAPLSCLFVAAALLTAGCAALEAPPGKVHRIGYVSSAAGATFEGFREALRAEGYEEGKNIVIETRFSEGRQERFPQLVAELLQRDVDVLLAGSPPAAIAAIRAETKKPIVIAGVSDPAGLARALGRPVGHITGTNLSTAGLGGKWIEVLKEANPSLMRAAVLINPAHPGYARWAGDIRASARALGIEIELLEANDAASLDRALAALDSSQAQGLVVSGDPVYLVNRARIIALVERKRLPAVYFSKLFADAGGLLAYGGSLEDSYRKAPRYIARILEGSRPSDLPIEETRIELVINRRAARALGVTLPESLIARATHVID